MSRGVYMIEREAWKSATGESVERSVRVRVLPGDASTCEWKYDDSVDTWDTECEGSFLLNYGTLRDNNMRFCPYCGKTIVEISG